jgi:hypothetical protein
MKSCWRNTTVLPPTVSRRFSTRMLGPVNELGVEYVKACSQ